MLVAIWNTPAGEEITLADNTAARGTRERWFVQWLPNFTQDVQTASKVDGDTKFNHDRGNIGIEGRLIVSWYLPAAELARELHELPGRLKGTADLYLSFLGGADVHIVDCTFLGISVQEFMPTRATFEISVRGSTFNVG